jgi:hypothetical protein
VRETVFGFVLGVFCCVALKGSRLIVLQRVGESSWLDARLLLTGAHCTTDTSRMFVTRFRRLDSG